MPAAEPEACLLSRHRCDSVTDTRPSTLGHINTPASLTWGASWDQAYHTPPMDYKPNGLGGLLERRQEARSAQRRLLGRRLALPRAMGAPIESCVCRRSQSALPSHFFGCDDDGARESLRACWAIPTDTVLSCTTMTFLSKPTFLWSKPTLSLAHIFFFSKPILYLSGQLLLSVGR